MRPRCLRSGSQRTPQITGRSVGPTRPMESPNHDYWASHLCKGPPTRSLRHLHILGPKCCTRAASHAQCAALCHHIKRLMKVCSCCCNRSSHFVAHFPSNHSGKVQPNWQSIPCRASPSERVCLDNHPSSPGLQRPMTGVTNSCTTPDTESQDGGRTTHPSLKSHLGGRTIRHEMRLM